MNPFDCHACDGQVDDHDDDCAYAPKSSARPAHPNTMIGRP